MTMRPSRARGGGNGGLDESSPYTAPGWGARHASLALLLLLPLTASAEQLRLPVIADTSLQAHPSEINCNSGGSPIIRVKGNEHYMLIKFDLHTLAGRAVGQATLHLHDAHPNMLRTVGLSTITADWDEGTGTGGAATDGCTFLRAAPGRLWAGPGSDILDVALTHGGSRVWYTDIRAEAGGWFAVDVPPELVALMAAGLSHGLCLSDEKGQTMANNDVHSREQNAFAPYMVVEADDAAVTLQPAPVTPTAARPAKSLPAPLPRLAEDTGTGQEPTVVNGLRVWAAPAECKVSPITGAALEEAGPAGAYRRCNPVWDGATVRVAGARGEVVALQVVVESAGRTLPTVSLTCQGEPAPVGVYRDWYVNDGGLYAEYLAPLTATQAIPNQRCQSYTIVWEVPRDAKPGAHDCQVGLRAEDGTSLRIPVRLQVRDFEIPAKVSFELSLNSYGPVGDNRWWRDYLTLERRYYAAAHALRGTLVSLGYSHSGITYRGYAPEIAGEGKDTKVVDWTDYDQHWGPYLDGSAFTTGVRAGVPISHLYLPLHEAWPTPMTGHYSAGNDIRKYPDNIIAHAMTAPPIEQAFDQASRDAFIAVTRQFVEHFKVRGWVNTEVQCYQNDKYYYKDERSNFRGTSWWLLDEPMHRDDWLALRYFGGLFRQGKGDASSFIFRADVSRPQLQRDWLDGCVDLMCVAGELFTHPQHCRHFRDMGVKLWHYGEANAISASNLNAVAWALKAYCGGADGIVPWNSIGGDGALDTPTPTALLVPGTRFGQPGSVVSLRLLALCRGAQDVEYLNLLARKRRYDRDQMARPVGDALKLSGSTEQRYTDDAGRVVFERLSCEDVYRLRAAVAAALEG